MSLLQRVSREPNAIAGLIAGAYGLLVAFGVLELTVQQVGACIAFWGAVVFFLRWLTTPSAEVVVQHRAGEDAPVAGDASVITTGAPVDVHVSRKGFGDDGYGDPDRA